MPLRKIGEAPRFPSAPSIPAGCQSPEHNPPNMIVLEPGVYEHTCPACGAKQVFTVADVSRMHSGSAAA